MASSNASIVATVVIGVIIIAGLGYTYYATSSSLSSLSSQNVSLGQQASGLSQQVAGLNQQVSVLQQRTVQVVTVSNTIVTVETTTSVTASVIMGTQMIYSTFTTTQTVYPPSNSTYPLTYVTGNATITQPSCGGYVVSVDVTYEVHSQVSQNIIEWAAFPSGQLVQPSTQKDFSDQAYLTIFSTYDYSSGYCSVGQIASLSAFVTDSNNNQLSPSTYFVVQSA